ncbi:MAG TPA: YidC/Oxa1 family membrane protein insertase [Solirubrobacteraceae bacterium]|jgi:YidC/Oxa1 family membrane protein insertase|nr:YidC/Oxa1 family membrane protein insertase [Solirubrobacteraceae bacterium]
MLFFANILQPLISVFEALIKFFHNNLGVGWGLSIVLLTVLVRAILVPLTVKQFRSMQALQAHQPELKALQAKYKDDKQRLNQEIMKFYKENKVNPLGSCLPLLAQFPVFISLYYLLRSDLRGYICPHTQALYKAAHHTTATVACGVHNGAQFLFIGDLTNKATGAVLVVLMVLYVGSQLFSSLMMSTSAMDPTQRKIMVLMPLVFVFLFISFPAGVIVYWITTNLWTIVQQVIVRRIVGPPPTPATAKAAGEDGGSSGGDGGTATTTRKSQPRAPKPTAEPAPSASSAAKSAVSGLLRRRLEPAPESSGARGGSRTGPPPRSPRKKKKRSGRRR